VRTIFLSGLPVDVQEREIHLLFRFFAGYEGCSISRPEGKQPVAFASFTEPSLAGRAKDILQGFKFDLTSAYPMRVELARSNSKVKRLPRDFLEGDFRKRLNVTEDLPSPYPPAYPPFMWLNAREAPAPQFAFSPFVNPTPPTSPSVTNPTSNNSATPTTGPKISGVLATLFVGNLALDVQRNDLTRLFYLMPGFKELRMTHRNEHPIAFVEFSDGNSALQAMKALQGAPIGSTRIRIEFAKKRSVDPEGLPAKNHEEKAAAEVSQLLGTF